MRKHTVFDQFLFFNCVHSNHPVDLTVVFPLSAPVFVAQTIDAPETGYRLKWTPIFFFCRVQEIDGSYFESFTALAWKQENQRQNAIKVAESSATEPPPQESDVGITPIDYSLPQNEKDKLYVEMLYTITNTVSWFCYERWKPLNSFVT